VKKTSVPAVLSTGILCYLFWLVITGQLVSIIRGEPSIQVIVFGLVVSFFVALFSARFFIHEKAGYLWHPARFFKLLFYCIITFPIELFKANIDVAFRALNPRLPINPGIVKVPTDLKSDYAQAMLADSITLTPGTITMAIAEEEGKTNYYIHWINVQTEDPEEAGDAIKGTLEKAIRGIWE